jgi:Uma2 family endonuclease
MTTTEERAESIPGYRSRMTEEEFERWALAERVRAEWVEGEVVLMSPVSYEHTDIFEWMLSLMKFFAAKHKLGEVHGSEYMSRLKGRRRLPDIFFAATGREGLFTRNYFDGAPDLIVEIVSRDSQNRDRRDKYLEYQSNGVREYWIIDPLSQSTEFYELRDGKYVAIPEENGILRSKVFTGFWLQVEWLWKRPLPDPLETARTLGIF